MNKPLASNPLGLAVCATTAAGTLVVLVALALRVLS